ncbi:hypothetical protein [Planotetraspora phitsanulokensis]|uniref:Uncharacterized protein n=1 Tax=Planotetraspora phitsanulokensis TaxID=575192 RepID=A0A8J3XBI1_9ACTN|nr:hypothetical protein [Planotetraspora phitsanulokensis]GII35060.1 hypothetical protein Pph01_00630 [Planotetraspora phitsanulokensis]
MGLDVFVGILTYLDDEEGIDHYRGELAMVTATLKAAGLPAWHEPAVDPAGAFEEQMYGYSGLHYLRRLAVHVAATGVLPPPGGEDASHDPLLLQAYEGDPSHAVVVADTVTVVGSPEAARGGFDHLVHHSDAEGYYVPLDFQPVIIGERVVGDYLGSSHRLLDECLRLARLLELPDDLDPWSDAVCDAAEGDVSDPSAGWQRYGVESFTCLRLIAAARTSIRTGAALTFA